jgi:spore cortex biosynthesis protein YabQ
MSDENIFLLYAIYMGVYITFIYDIIRVFRRVFAHGEWLVSLEDIGFWIYCTGKVFVVMYRLSDGMLRWFAVLGALAGMCLYKKFISGFFVKYSTMALTFVKIKAQKAIIFLVRPAVKRYRKIKKKLTIAVKMLKMTIAGLHNSDNKNTKNKIKRK